MRIWNYHMGKLFKSLLITGALMMILPELSAQQPVKLYTIKNGNMYILLSKKLQESSLDSFITQYALQDLALKNFLQTGFDDSLLKHGWRIAVNNKQESILTKDLKAFENINNPIDRIQFKDIHKSADLGFPAVSNEVVFGYNRFKNKHPFRINDSVVTFYLRNNLKAKRVMLAGSFNDWKPDALAMKATDSGWIASVKLSPGKYWYKFIIDGNWIIDQDNRLNENDGRGNTNSVFYVTNVRFRLDNFMTAKKVRLAGSFNNWEEDELVMKPDAAGWELPLYLADGTHTYRFVVDGQWMEDPANPDRFPNEFKGYNSVVRLGKPLSFRLKGFTDARQVVLTGSFQKWKSNELFMKKTASGWELDYTLGPGNHVYKVIIDGKELTTPGAALTVDQHSHENSLIILQANHTFRLRGYAHAKEVFLSGDFNNWDPKNISMKKEGDEWVYSVYLSPGKHLYKFVVDGEWVIDPGNKSWEQNEFGTGNSVIWVEQGKDQSRLFQ